jgi:hypothetical protein
MLHDTEESVPTGARPASEKVASPVNSFTLQIGERQGPTPQSDFLNFQYFLNFQQYIDGHQTSIRTRASAQESPS